MRVRTLSVNYLPDCLISISHFYILRVGQHAWHCSHLYIIIYQGITIYIGVNMEVLVLLIGNTLSSRFLVNIRIHFVRFLGNILLAPGIFTITSRDTFLSLSLTRLCSLSLLYYIYSSIRSMLCKSATLQSIFDSFHVCFFSLWLLMGDFLFCLGLYRT